MKYFAKDAFLNDVAGICWEQGLIETNDVDILVAHWSSPGVAPGIFCDRGADSSNEGAKIRLSGYCKCQKSPKK